MLFCLAVIQLFFLHKLSLCCCCLPLQTLSNPPQNTAPILVSPELLLLTALLLSSELCVRFYPAACCCWTMIFLKYVNLSMDINHLPWFPVTIMWLLPHQPFWWNCLPWYRIYLRMSLAEHCGISQSQLGCIFVEVHSSLEAAEKYFSFSK